jgi:hypothetical protein
MHWIHSFNAFTVIFTSFSAKNCIGCPQKKFYFPEIEDFAALGAYIIDYIMVYLSNGDLKQLVKGDVLEARCDRCIL